MAIREASIADASSIAVISVEVWVGTYLKRGVRAHFADYVLNTFTKENAAKRIVDVNHSILVSENEDGIDGFIEIAGASPAPVDGCSDVEISTVYVQPHHHGRGIGKSLLRAALDRASKQGARSVWVAVNAENQRAISFYAGEGFEQVGQTKFIIENEGYLNYVYQVQLI